MKNDPDDSVVRAYLRELAAGPAAELPEARLIWWKARMRERFEARERAIRPIRLIETLACLLCFAAAVALLIFGRDSVAAVLDSVRRSPLAPLAAVTLAMTLGAAAFLIRVVLSEE